MSDNKNGSSYFSEDVQEGSSGGGRKLQYIYPDKLIETQQFVLIPDQGDWHPYAPQTVKYHGGAVKLYIKGAEDDGARRFKVACKGRDCPVCRDLDKKYPQIKDQPFQESRKHSKLFLIVPVTMRQNRYQTNKTLQFMQVEYPFRYDSVSKESVNVEWKDLSHAIRSVMEKGIDPFDLTKAVVFERTRESEPSPSGKGTRKIWRHSVIQNSSGTPVTIELPHDMLDQLKKHRPLEGYAADLGIPDLQLLVDVGNQQEELMRAMATASSTEKAAISEAMDELNTALHKELGDLKFRQRLESAEKYAANARQTETYSDESEPEEARFTPPPAVQKSPAHAVPVSDLKTTGADTGSKTGETPMSAADAVRNKYGFRRK